MSRSLKRIFAFVLVLVLSLTTIVCADSVSIVSPAANSISYSDSLLVSVKVSDPKTTIRVTVFEEQGSRKVYQKDEKGNFVKDEKGKKIKVTELYSLDVTDLTEADLKSIQDVYEGVVTQGALMSNGAIAEKYTSTVYQEPETFTSKSDIGIYTATLTDVTPGLYRIQVETISVVKKKEVVTDTVNSFVIVKEKPEEEENLFETEQSGALQTIKEVLKSIFK